MSTVRSVLKIGSYLALTAGLILAVGPTPAAGDQLQPTAVQFADRVAPTVDVPLELAPAVDRDAVRVEDIEREAAGLAPRFAIPNPVELSHELDGTWESAGDAQELWRLRIASPGAHSINLGFSRYEMPEGGRLLIHAADLSSSIRPFTAADNARHGELWTPPIFSDEIVVEVTIPAGTRPALKLDIRAINVGYRGFDSGESLLSGSCNIDVVCPQGDGWRDEIPSVAVISTGGSLFCTGFMVNNTAQDQTPYFMTAYHCGISSGNAASLVAYWNYETSSCGGTPNGSLSDFQSGSFFRSRYSPSDFVLVELDSAPDPAWGVTFAGWDRSGNDAVSAVAIHHPSVDEKRISFENDATTTTSYLSNSVPGDGTHIRVIDWDLGTTEGGSSGSPLFDQNHRVIGQLHGGYASCSSQTSDWYGKISVSWNGGGSSSSRLSDWLDPGNTGATTVDTLVPGGCSTNAECDDGLFCNGAETCSGSGSCQAGGDPCPGQDCDESSDTCIPLVCNNDGTCNGQEDCTNCGADCISGSGGCGNGVCEPSLGEDCLSCSADCRGKQSGKPSNRYCCGDGDGTNPVGCGDSRCTSSGFDCSDTPGGSYCCGDGVCEGAEDSFNCEIDCGPAGFCGDAICEAGEDSCSCAADCGAPPVESCSNGVDDDCDGATDCADSDCSAAPECQCGARGDACSSNADCCSNRCKNNGTCR